jgi:hypothetical protein
MTTTVIKSIKAAGGGDYTSLSSWETARRGDITATGRDTIEIAEVYDKADTGLTLSSANWTVDASHYIWIRAASGYAHLGIYSETRAYFRSIDCSIGYLHLGPGISMHDPFNSEIYIHDIPAAQCIVEGLIINNTSTNGMASSYGVIGFYNCNAGATHIVKNCVVVKNSHGYGVIGGRGSTNQVKIYNCTLRIPDEGVNSVGFLLDTGTVFTSQNNYFGSDTRNYFTGYGGTINKGANDATKNTEATTPSLQNIAYSTANFINVTLGSEDLHILKTGALYNTGANLTSEGVTTDFEGTTRPQFGVFDIGADENGVPVCWNYTARYKNSNKLFKASGCGDYPKSLRTPSNIDKSTGRMVDDGIEIDPTEYEVI